MKRSLPQLLLAFLLIIPWRDILADDLLSRAKEPAFVGQAGVEQYRLIYSPTFDNPLIMRVTKAGQRISLRVVQFSGAGGYDPGRIRVDKTIVLTPKDWQRITTLAEASRFWTMPTNDNGGGDDGSTWVFEGSRPDAQHLVSRWTPTYRTKERELERFVLFGRYLMTLSGLKITIH